LEGEGFTGVTKIYFNGYSSYFNPVFVTDNNIIVQVSSDTPMKNVPAGKLNTIVLEKGSSIHYSYTFDIRASAPSVSGVSHTMPGIGELIRFEGSNLQGIKKVVFPGDVTVTDEITSDEDGRWFTVPMPEGVSDEGGFVYFEGTNGGGYSPTSFNFKKGVILDFDGLGSQGFWSWSETGSMINADDLEDAVTGNGHVSQGKYVNHHPGRLPEFAATKNRCSEVWTAGNGVDDWRGQLTSYIPASTAVDKVAFQFDVYVPDAWAGSGFIGIYLYNSYSGGEWGAGSDSYPNYVFNYVPWLDGKTIVPFQTMGWTTVTLPFNKMGYLAEGTHTFEEVLAAREKSSYCNFGVFFNNSDIKYANISGNADDEEEFASSATSVKIYTDNWRIVSLDAPEYSDFPDEE
jgi:hypothetical protein